MAKKVTKNTQDHQAQGQIMPRTISHKYMLTISDSGRLRTKWEMRTLKDFSMMYSGFFIDVRSADLKESSVGFAAYHEL